MAAAKHGLGEFLRSLSEIELAEVLRRRPDASLAPEPRTLAELAKRLSTPHSASQALVSLDLTGLRLLETICALGPECSRDQVHVLLGAVAAGTLDTHLHELRSCALAWEQGGRLHVDNQLRALLPNPLGLGRPAEQLLAALTVEQLKSIGARYGLEKLPRKTDWVAGCRLREEERNFALGRSPRSVPSVERPDRPAVPDQAGLRWAPRL